MTEYNPDLTLAIAAAVDRAAKEHHASIEQMLMSSAVFTAGMIHANFSHDLDQREAALKFHEMHVREFAADILQKETPAG